jgi:hypothetical protein
MATLNTMIICDHCSSKIRIRAGIGYSEIQPFSFACKSCGNIIKGELRLNGPENCSFNFINATQTDKYNLKDADFTIECHEDFLLTDESFSLEECEGEDLSWKPSPFMMMCFLMGDKFEEFASDRSLFVQNQKRMKRELFRINNFYVNDNKLEFEKAAKDYICCESKIDIYKALTQLNELYFLPILKKGEIESNCSFFKKQILSLLHNKKDELLKLTEELEKINFFQNQLDENLSLLENFDELFFEVKPITTLNYMKTKNTDHLMFSIVNFNKIKQFYVDLFECVGRELNLLIGLRNLEINGYHNLLNLPNFTNIKNFHDCITSSNGRKKEYLNNSSYSYLIDDTFDNKLRNGVGHYKCTYDQHTQDIEYYPYIGDISKSRKETISYVNFVSKLYDLFNLLISLMYLKALVYTVHFANKSILPHGLKDISLLVLKRFPISFKNVDLIVEDKPPVIRLIHFWNSLGYNRPEIVNHNFNYWNFTSLYEIFGFCENDQTKVNIDLDDDTIYITVNKTKRFKFKIYEHIEWYNLLMYMNEFLPIQSILETEIPYFNIVHRYP